MDLKCFGYQNYLFISFFHQFLEIPHHVVPSRSPLPKKWDEPGSELDAFGQVGSALCRHLPAPTTVGLTVYTARR